MQHELVQQIWRGPIAVSARDVGITYALVVNDLNDGSETVDEFAMGEEDDAADFHVAPCGGVDFDFCHLWRLTLG